MSSNSNKRPLSAVLTEDEIERTLPDSKKAKLKDERDVMAVTLASTALVRHLDITNDVVQLISCFGRGHIVECCKCKQQGHVDGVEPLDEEVTKHEEFSFYRVYDGDLRCIGLEILCMGCYNTTECDLCGSIFGQEGCKCDSCAQMICHQCEKDGEHMREHGETFSPGPTEQDIDQAFQMAYFWMKYPGY